MGAQTFHQKAGGNDDLMITEMFLLEQHGLFFEFATHATIKLAPGFRAEFLEDLAPCRTLKHIKLLTDEEIFEPLDKHAKLPWEDAFTSKELSRVLELSEITGLRMLKNIRGLQTVKFMVTFSHLINSPSKHKIFADNLTRLLAIVQRPTIRLFEQPTIVDQKHGKGLYFGSQVLFHTQRKHHVRVISQGFIALLSRLVRIMALFSVLHVVCLAQSLLLFYFMPSMVWASINAFVVTIVCLGA